MRVCFVKIKKALLFGFLILSLSLSLMSPAHAQVEEPACGISLEGEIRLKWPCGIPFEDPGFVAVGKDGEDMSQQVSTEGEVICWKTGTYRISYSFQDTDGQIYSAKRVVKIVPAELPETVQTEKTIYLTFDDGPCEYTERILELLEAYDAKATFFIIGYDGNDYIDWISTIHEKGHSIGVHCSNHDYGRLYSSEEYFFEDHMKTRQLIYELTGEHPALCRFPGGSVTARSFLGHKTEGGFETIERRLNDMGVRYHDWNIQLEGAGGEYRTATDMYYTFINTVPKYETPVLLQHDTLLYSVNILEKLLIWGTENGYTFAAMDSTTPEVHSEY